MHVVDVRIAILILLEGAACSVWRAPSTRVTQCPMWRRSGPPGAVLEDGLRKLNANLGENVTQLLLFKPLNHMTACMYIKERKNLQKKI